MKPRLCLGELTWVEATIQSKTSTWSPVNLQKKKKNRYIAGRKSHVFLGIANAVLMVVLSKIIAATPLAVDAASKTVGFSGFIEAFL